MIIVDLTKYKLHSTLCIEVKTKPVAQSRPRFNKTGGMYDPSSKFKKAFISSAKKSIDTHRDAINEILYYPDKYIHALEVVYYQPLVKGTQELEPSLSAQDIDNMEKFVYDSLQGICFGNDNRIFSTAHAKLRSKEPKTSLIIKNYRRKE